MALLVSISSGRVPSFTIRAIDSAARLLSLAEPFPDRCFKGPLNDPVRDSILPSTPMFIFAIIYSQITHFYAGFHSLGLGTRNSILKWS